jgi:uncharacterized membrane protein YgcG
MPRDLPAGLTAILAACESQDIIKIILPIQDDSSTPSPILAGTDDVIIDATSLWAASMMTTDMVPVPNAEAVSLYGTYPAELKGIDDFVQSITKATDSVTFTYQNVDTLIGQVLLDDTIQLDGTQVVYMKVHRYDETQPWFVTMMFKGVLDIDSIDEEQAKLPVSSELAASLVQIGDRPVASLCDLIFDTDDTPNPICGYRTTSTLAVIDRIHTDCNHIYGSADGCLGRENQHRHHGFVFQTAPTQISTGGGGFGGPGGGDPGGGDPGGGGPGRGGPGPLPY